MYLKFRGSLTEMDSRFRGNDGSVEVDSRFLPAFARMMGNDGPKKTISACSSTSLAVNLSHMLLRSEIQVFRATTYVR